MSYPGQPHAPVASTSTLPLPTSAGSPSLSPPASNTTAVKQKKTRTRNGCLTCRSRKKRCDEQHPKCAQCSRLALNCQWEDKEKSAIERKEKRERRKKERELKKRNEGTSEKREESAGKMEENLAGLEALATAGMISSMSDYPPSGAPDPVLFDYSPHDMPVSLPDPTSTLTQPAWTGFLGSFAPAPFTSGPSDIGWTTSFPQLNAPPTPQIDQGTSLSLPPTTTQDQNSNTQLSELDITSWLNHGDLPLSFSSLVRSPSPARPFDPDLSALFPSFGDFDILSLPPDTLDHPSFSPATADVANSLALVTSPSLPAVNSLQNPSHALAAPSPPQLLKSAVNRAASVLASSDFAFTRAYLLSHYTTSLAQHVSIASSSSTPSSPASPRSRPSARSTAASANLFLSLIPHAHRNPFLMHSILSWSSANLAAASSSKGNSRPGTSNGEASQPSEGPGSQSAMGSLSDELGTLAEGLLEEVIPKLRREGRNEEDRGRSASRTDQSAANGKTKVDESKVEFEPVLAGVLMLCQAAICRGDVEKWRERLRQAAQVVNLVGGLSQCRSPLARQLVRNLLYHDVLSSSSSKHGLLLDYSSLRPNGPEGATPASSKNSTTGLKETEEEFEDDEDEEVLDTLMGVAEPVFLLIGKITSLAREKHDATKRNGGMIPEEELADFLRKIDEVRARLELEKARVDSFVVERPDLEPHRYFHEVFRLAALLYLHMVSEVPPRAYPVLLLVRKMLSLFEVIVNEKLPGLCSCHFALYVMHLNSTPLISPHSQLNDRQRSTKVFDHHMQAFTFLNTKRSRALIDEAWTRSNEGRLFVDPDTILEEWKWDLNFA